MSRASLFFLSKFWTLSWRSNSKYSYCFCAPLRAARPDRCLVTESGQPGRRAGLEIFLGKQSGWWLMGEGPSTIGRADHPPSSPPSPLSLPPAPAWELGHQRDQGHIPSSLAPIRPPLRGSAVNPPHTHHHFLLQPVLTSGLLTKRTLGCTGGSEFENTK